MNHRAFSAQMVKCGQDAAKAVLRCHFTAKPVTVSILISENQPFPPRSFPYGNMNQGTFSDQMAKCGQGGRLADRPAPPRPQPPPRPAAMAPCGCRRRPAPPAACTTRRRPVGGSCNCQYVITDLVSIVNTANICLFFVFNLK